MEGGTAACCAAAVYASAAAFAAGGFLLRLPLPLLQIMLRRHAHQVGHAVTLGAGL